eukprot:649423-Pelagomonas_calceolata.AAC.1
MGKSKQAPASEKSDGFLSLEQDAGPSVPKLAQAANKKSRQEQQQQSQDDNAAQPSGSSRCVPAALSYLFSPPARSNLPHGFYEKELLGGWLNGWELCSSF